MTKSAPRDRIAKRRGRDSWVLILTLLCAAVISAGMTLVLRALPSVTPTVELKILGIALAVGLDVLALSIAIGIMQVPFNLRLRLALAFSASEIIMQLIGYAIGTGADRLVGTIANYVGFAVLAGVGAFIVAESFTTEESFKVASGWGLVAASASISLDSLGIGVSLPGVPLPLAPLLATVGVSTILFTIVGLAFGNQLGQRYRHLAELVAGIVLIVLAVFFTAQHLWNWGV